MNILLFSFLFFLPAGVANMMPVFVAKIPGLKKYSQPLDFGLTFHNKRILGDHKTIRGIVSGVVVGTAFAYILSMLVLSLYQGTNPVLIGFLLSFGALLGDAIKSFFKRQIGISTGASWFPFDQTDYIIGGLLLSLFALQLSVQIYVIIFLEYFLLHLVVSFVGYLLGFKESAI